MPRKAVDSEVRLRSLNLKTTEALRSQLENAARQSGHALTHEVESRLEQSFTEERLLHRMMGGDGDISDFLQAVHQVSGRVKRVCEKIKTLPEAELYAAIDTIARVYFLPPTEWPEDYGRTGAKPEGRPGLAGQEAAYQWLWWNGDPRLERGEDQMRGDAPPQRSLSDIMAEANGGRDRNAAAPPRPSDSGPDEGDDLPLDMPAEKPKRARKVKPKT